MAKKSSTHKDYSDAELERIGKMVITIGETGFRNKAVLYRMAFIKGVLGGVGGVIGATVIIALLLFILSLVSEIPLIGNVAEKLQNTVETSTR